jgi:hypothetical protein
MRNGVFAIIWHFQTFLRLKAENLITGHGKSVKLIFVTTNNHIRQPYKNGYGMGIIYTHYWFETFAERPLSPPANGGTSGSRQKGCFAVRRKA